MPPIEQHWVIDLVRTADVAILWYMLLVNSFFALLLVLGIAWVLFQAVWRAGVKRFSAVGA